ncbi:hypothetical protein R2F61_07340 [Mollicutes bacterium LVI A0078]|nr:hypothetical protein R2F61_07340 [Mollicutes bacterium LVI A0078]
MYTEYKKSIERILKNSCLETSMYHLIQKTIEDNTKYYSLDISQTQTRNRFHKVYNTPAGISDIAVFSKYDKLLFYIEVKWFVRNQTEPSIYKQLLGQSDKHKKIMFTDGLNWKFYKLENGELIVDWEVNLGNYPEEKGKIIWNNYDEWKKLTKLLKNIRC